MLDKSRLIQMSFHVTLHDVACKCFSRSQSYMLVHEKISYKGVDTGSYFMRKIPYGPTN